MTPACDCQNWADHKPQIRFLTGHHDNCPNKPNELQCAIALIRELTKALEVWGAEEDGIFPPAWDAYRKGKSVIGEFDWKEDANG